MRAAALDVQRRNRPLPASKDQEGFTEEVRLEWGGIYTGEGGASVTHSNRM